MTARQLLSILRLSQALAKLRFTREVSRDDIDEAIRLIYASKSSILEPETNKTENSESAIFTIITGLFESQRSRELPFVFVESTIIKRGFTPAQLKYCLDDYSTLGVIEVSIDGSTIALI